MLWFWRANKKTKITHKDCQLLHILGFHVWLKRVVLFLCLVYFTFVIHFLLRVGGLFRWCCVVNNKFVARILIFINWKNKQNSQIFCTNSPITNSEAIWLAENCPLVGKWRSFLGSQSEFSNQWFSAGFQFSFTFTKKIKILKICEKCLLERWKNFRKMNFPVSTKKRTCRKKKSASLLPNRRTVSIW